MSVTQRELTGSARRGYSSDTVKTLFLSASICFAALCLSGCGSNFLVGKWTIDQERTVAELSPGDEPVKDAEGLLKAIGKGLQKGIAQILLAQFEGTTLEFTSTELRKVREGVGTTVTYEIIDRPQPGTYLVKYADGEITTWEKVEGGLRLKLNGMDKDHWVYFVPAGK